MLVVSTLLDIRSRQQPLHLIQDDSRILTSMALQCGFYSAAKRIEQVLRLCLSQQTHPSPSHWLRVCAWLAALLRLRRRGVGFSPPNSSRSLSRTLLTRIEAAGWVIPNLRATVSSS